MSANLPTQLLVNKDNSRPWTT